MIKSVRTIERREFTDKFEVIIKTMNLERKLKEKNILEYDEIEFIQTLYSNATITIGNTEQLNINKR